MKLRPSFPVEIYISEDGYICLKTEADLYNPDDQLIFLSPPQVSALLKQFPKLIKIALPRWNDGIESESDEILDED